MNTILGCGEFLVRNQKALLTIPSLQAVALRFPFSGSSDPLSSAPSSCSAARSRTPSSGGRPLD